MPYAIRPYCRFTVQCFVEYTPVHSKAAGHWWGETWAGALQTEAARGRLLTS